MTQLIAIWLTFFAALVISVVPVPRDLPVYLFYLQPEWLALTLSYWVLVSPERVGLVSAFVLGLFADLSVGTALGEHGLMYLLLVMFISATYHQVRMLPIWQQAVIVAFVISVGTILQYLFLSLAHESFQSGLMFLKAIVSALMWPWVFLLLEIVRRRFRWL
jgi:rod shape-determining protein MreD